MLICLSSPETGGREMGKKELIKEVVGKKEGVVVDDIRSLIRRPPVEKKELACC